MRPTHRVPCRTSHRRDLSPNSATHPPTPPRKRRAAGTKGCSPQKRLSRHRAPRRAGRPRSAPPATGEFCNQRRSEIQSALCTLKSHRAGTRAFSSPSQLSTPVIVAAGPAVWSTDVVSGSPSVSPSTSSLTSARMWWPVSARDARCPSRGPLPALRRSGSRRRARPERGAGPSRCARRASRRRSTRDGRTSTGNRSDRASWVCGGVCRTGSRGTKLQDRIR